MKFKRRNCAAAAKGGLRKAERAETPCKDSAETGVGAIKANFSATGGYSIFNWDTTAVDFCSAFFPAAMARHNGQRCWPSKVWETASVNDCLQRLSANIVLHATVCSATQCDPVAKTRAATTKASFNAQQHSLKINTTSQSAVIFVWQAEVVIQRFRSSRKTLKQHDHTIIVLSEMVIFTWRTPLAPSWLPESAAGS